MQKDCACALCTVVRARDNGFCTRYLGTVSALTMGEAEPSAKLEQHFEQYCLGLVPTPCQRALPCGLHAMHFVWLCSSACMNCDVTTLVLAGTILQMPAATSFHVLHHVSLVTMGIM